MWCVAAPAVCSAAAGPLSSNACIAAGSSGGASGCGERAQVAAAAWPVRSKHASLLLRCRKPSSSSSCRWRRAGGGGHQRHAQRSPHRDRFVVSATVAPINANDEDSATPGGQSSTAAVAAPSFDSVSAFASAFYRFSRPHTVIGTIISICSVSLLAIGHVRFLHARSILGLFQALIPALCINVAIVGLNQVYDIEIDKVNKPYLPLASGEFSKEFGAALSWGFAALGITLGLLAQSPGLTTTLIVSLLLGVAYSIDLPFLRWKRFPVLAASCILSVRAVLVQLGFFHHMRVGVLRQKWVVGRPLAFATAFMCFYSVVIALFKDIPDVEGDRKYAIRSLSVQIGADKVFWICVGLLLAAYGAAVIFGLCSPQPWSAGVLVAAHIGLGALLWSRAKKVDVRSKAALTDFYMFIWKLFYAEYLILPFAR
eukprot:jgi/Chlat1/6963/Chrsp52S06618